MFSPINLQDGINKNCDSRTLRNLEESLLENHVWQDWKHVWRRPNMLNLVNCPRMLQSCNHPRKQIEQLSFIVYVCLGRFIVKTITKNMEAIIA